MVFEQELDTAIRLADTVRFPVTIRYEGDSLGLFDRLTIMRADERRAREQRAEEFRIAVRAGSRALEG